MSELGDFVSPSLGAFDLSLCLDPSVLTFVDVGFGPFLGDEAAGEAITGFSLIDDLMVFEVSLLLPAELIALQPDSFTLLTVTFDASFPGTSPLDIIANVLSDELGDPLPATVVNSSVTVQGTGAIVEIPTLSQWGMGILILSLLGAGVVRLRRGPTSGGI